MTTNFKYVQAQDFFLAGSGSIVGATSITLKSFKAIDGTTNLTMTDFGTVGYATIEPGNGIQEEQISFTGVTQNANGTATLTGVKNVSFVEPYTETSGTTLTHAGSTTLIITNTSGFYNKFPAKDNDETIEGDWTFNGQATFSVFPITPSNSDASTTVKGVSKTSVAPATANNPIVVGTNDPRVPVAYAVDAVGTDAYAITPSPAITAYAAGQLFTFKAGTANTGAATLNVNALGAKDIKKDVSAALVTGDILLNQIVTVVYDGTNMQLVSPESTKTADIQTFTTAGADTWTKPGYGNLTRVQVWGGGGSGAKGSASAGTSGGGGGGYKEVWFTTSALGATEPITVGAGGASQTTANTGGNVGGNSTFGASSTLVTAYGGGAGKNGDLNSDFGGGGGGALSVGSSGVTGTGGSPLGGTSSAGAAPTDSTFGGGGGGSGATSAGAGKGGDSIYGGGGGGGAGTAAIIGGAGGASIWGGGGGGGDAFDSSPGPGAGGTSSYGGAGGAGAYDANNGTAGSQPGGGGGGAETGNSGAGGDGKVIVTTYN